MSGQPHTKHLISISSVSLDDLADIYAIAIMIGKDEGSQTIGSGPIN